MKKFEVTFYYHTNCTVKVEAEDEEEALAIAENKVCDPKYEAQIMEGLQEDDEPDVEEVKD